MLSDNESMIRLDQQGIESFESFTILLRFKEVEKLSSEKDNSKQIPELKDKHGSSGCVVQ